MRPMCRPSILFRSVKKGCGNNSSKAENRIESQDKAEHNQRTPSTDTLPNMTGEPSGREPTLQCVPMTLPLFAESLFCSLC